MAGNLASSPLRRGAADFLRYAQWQATWLGHIYGEAPQMFAVTRSSCPASGQIAVMADNLASSLLQRGAADFRRCAEFLSCIFVNGKESGMVCPFCGKAPQTFAVTRSSCPACGQNCIIDKQSGFAPSTERRRRLSPLRGILVLHMGQWH